MTSETPCLPGCREVRDWFPGYHNHACPNAPKPAEPPACDCWKHERQVCDICQGVGGKDKPQSEPPIADGVGVGVGVGVGIANLFMGHEAETAGKVLARAYLSLKAERDALKGKATALELELAASDASRKSSTHNLTVANEENAALKARVEAAGLAEALEWAKGRWHAEVEHRPEVNIHRRKLDETWQQVIRYLSDRVEESVIRARKEQEASNGK